MGHRLAGSGHGQYHLQQPPHVRHRHGGSRFFPPTGVSPTPETTTPTSPTSGGGASPASPAPHIHRVPLRPCPAGSSPPRSSGYGPLGPSPRAGSPGRHY